MTVSAKDHSVAVGGSARDIFNVHIEGASGLPDYEPPEPPGPDDAIPAPGTHHPNVAIRVNNLGLVQQAQGDLAGARASYERALRILENSQLPPDHPCIVSLKRKLEALG